jgi:hypothetical protein
MARSMALGTQGGFARYIGEAFMVADSNNQEKLFVAFEGLFDRVARFKNITPFEEPEHEAFIERRMSMLDKKLMQGHISQEDYDTQASNLNKAIPY